MKKPIVLVIMDGVGRGDGGPGDAVKQANTPTTRPTHRNYFTPISASPPCGH